jgi:nucleoside-diphosphate-sugar epimerase
MVNPAIILSPTRPGHSSGQLLGMVLRGSRHYPAGANGFVGVWDVAEAIQLLLSSDFAQGERFILSAENLSYKYVMNQLAEALGQRPPKRQLSPSLLHFMASFQEPIARLRQKPPMITHQSAITLSHRFYYDNAKFKAAMAYEFADIPSVAKAIAGRLDQ